MARQLIGGKAERRVDQNEKQKEKHREDRAARRKRETEMALAKMGVDPAELAPQIGLLSDVLNDAKGGVASVIRACRMSSNESIRAFLKQYDGVSEADRKRLPIEAYAIAAKLDLPRLLGMIMLVLRDRSASRVKVIALTAHPTVTQATVRHALKETGYRDRLMLHQGLGFLAVPKGQTINVNLPGFPEEREEDKLIPAEEIDMNEVFPDLMETQRKLLPD